jgi:membrane protein implicated in regulation of membrane protease activity
MDFISWLVVATLFMLAEFGVGKLYLVSIGLACIYASAVSYSHGSVIMQLGVLALGSAIHYGIVLMIRKQGPASAADEMPTDVGQRVEVIEWTEEGSARVMYNGKEWEADKAAGEMPNAEYGIIQAVQYGRLVIKTEAPQRGSTALPD